MPLKKWSFGYWFIHWKTHRTYWINVDLKKNKGCNFFASYSFQLMQALPGNNSCYPLLITVLGWQESRPESVHLMAYISTYRKPTPVIQKSNHTPPYPVVVPLFYSFCSQETVTMVCENLGRILNWTTNKHHPTGHYGALTALRTPVGVVIHILP